MVTPQGGAHVRAAEIRIPAHFTGQPTVTATVHAITAPASTGSVFGIFSITVKRLGTETQVVIQGTNVHAGQPVQDDSFATTSLSATARDLGACRVRPPMGSPPARSETATWAALEGEHFRRRF
jgi:hypothetical protein